VLGFSNIFDCACCADVEHGGYYLVTDSYNPKDPRKLRDKHPHRVRDFPPDETALLGVGIGYSQAGLLPIVEIPYAKYLDCGADIFWEAAIQNWLSNGKAPIGMLIRLQGFGNGVFGGNYHTHNSLSMPPGIDVVCYSNGSDYVRGMRFALQQAAAGRVVMTVDSTNLLNMRHVVGLDDAWKTAYPADVSDMLTFDHVIMHNDGGEGESACDTLVVTYGNGVVTSVQARHSLGETHDGSTTTFDIVDCPLLSEVPQGLIDLLEAGRGQYRSILFVDVCKQGQNPLAGHASMLQNRGLLDGVQWRMVTSQRTYNPLGSMITFVSQEDVIEAYHELN
jgi:2-oxoisovalerate dehydrogenase E1 component